MNDNGQDEDDGQVRHAVRMLGKAENAQAAKLRTILCLHSHLPFQYALPEDPNGKCTRA